MLARDAWIEMNNVYLYILYYYVHITARHMSIYIEKCSAASSIVTRYSPLNKSVYASLDKFILSILLSHA